MIRIVARDDLAIALAKKVFAAFLVVGVLVFVMPLSFAVALAVALRESRTRQKPGKAKLEKT